MPRVFHYKYSATLRQKVARFKRQLRQNPAMRCPPLDHDGLTAARHADYKHTTRAWDIARIELGLVTPMEVQRENAMMVMTPRARILEFAEHGPRRARAS